MANLIVLLVSTALLASSIMAESRHNNTDDSNKFAANLYKECVRNKPGNVILSPFSIRAALSLVAQGAEDVTYDAIQQNLYLPKTKQAIANNYKYTFESLTKNLNSAVTLDLANKVYVQDGFTIKQAFRSAAVDSFGSEVESVNFGDNVVAAKKINTWVEEKTHDKIKDLITSDSLDSDSRLVLVSAIYFKGNWANKFDPKLTKKDDFWVTPTESKKVDYMIQKNDFFYGVFESLDATVLKLGYNNSDISFWILLPNQRDGLAALESKLQTVNWDELNDNLFKTEVNVKIPKFKIESEFKLKDALEQLNLGNIFSNNAHFEGLLDTNQPLQVSDVVHKAFIEINEEGAEAAAATGVRIISRCLTICEEFIVNQPFYFVLRADRSETVLFNGRVKLPAA